MSMSAGDLKDEITRYIYNAARTGGGREVGATALLDLLCDVCYDLYVVCKPGGNEPNPAYWQNGANFWMRLGEKFDQIKSGLT